MRKPFLFALFIGVLAVQSCKKDDSDPYADLKTSIKQNHADVVYASYEDSYNAAIALQNAVSTFTASPSLTTFEAAKTAWKAAREPYGQTEAFRFAGGPIDDENGPEGLLNAWPLDEVYIDNVISGSTTIDKAYLESLNEQGGEANISVGYHAIEYLLWGSDITPPSTNLPGQRQYTDYVGSGNTESRRRQYLIACTDLLVEHLEYLKNTWAAGGSYRNTWLAMDNNVALTHILTGIGVLSKSELAGERMSTAFQTQDQEDEHSCFSDNTHRDIRTNVYGIQNVYNGSYTRTNSSVVSGASLDELLGKVDAALATGVSTQLSTAVSAVNATGVPFDLAISNQDATVPTAVNELRTLGDKFAEAGQKLGLTIDTNLPE